MKEKLFKAIGLMSGTSMDGVDIALVETDGDSYVHSLSTMTAPYKPEFRAKLRRHLGNEAGDPELAKLERELTELHADLVAQFLQQLPGSAVTVDLIGFHGQTISHQPSKRTTLQIGDGALLARMTRIPVICDFRSADVKAGGNGAPLVPLYHRALAADLPKPIAIINIGGVSNVTWIGTGADDSTNILAFDTGPGNALIDDWVLHCSGKEFDHNGSLAAQGRVDQALVKRFMDQPYFRRKPPKSCDRDAFRGFMPEGMTLADGAATLTRITAEAITQGLLYMPEKPLHLYVTGGGRLNETLMRWISDASSIDASGVDDLGWSGDGLEAEAFAYLAVRSRLGLPLSMPATTGVPEPMTGGSLFEPT